MTLEVYNWTDSSKLFLRREISLEIPSCPVSCMRAAFSGRVRTWTRQVLLVKDPALQRQLSAATLPELERIERNQA